ncbi:MAG: anaerobic benzoate catabolism transcriptional regulator [bacterium ADurb.Bin363]|nr:MAG: anaerobic benzoate catabolism transcriptional regulator [bacterium ADurb.Bin363]
MHKDVNIKKTLGVRIRKERINKDWSIELLAEYMDISPSFLASVERGERALSLEKLYKASITLGVTTDYLIKDSFPANSRDDSLNLLLSDLSDSEFRTVYEILQAVKKHLREIKP